jgi:hypothetical protein
VSPAESMQSTRRRTIPGMVSQRTEAPEAEHSSGVASEAESTSVKPGRVPTLSRRSVDYSVTRLVNFRLPADLHDRFRGLVREAEERYPRLRKASLTELVIALLEEGPRTAEEVADAIRRKRLAEHEDGLK